ncbi:hypothetical protein EBS43_00315 [bacterium]|nr:hypothetical protein [bacterium]
MACTSQKNKSDQPIPHKEPEQELTTHPLHGTWRYHDLKIKRLSTSRLVSLRNRLEVEPVLLKYSQRLHSWYTEHPHLAEVEATQTYQSLDSMVHDLQTISMRFSETQLIT